MQFIWKSCEILFIRSYIKLINIGMIDITSSLVHDNDGYFLCLSHKLRNAPSVTMSHVTDILKISQALIITTWIDNIR